MTHLVPLSSVDAGRVEELLDDAFGRDRFRRTAYMLRQGMPVIEHLSFAVTDGVSVVGSIQCWPVAVGNLPLILVGPVAVSPDRQGQGLGHSLMHASLGATQPSDVPMVMIGDPEYYSRFGFSADGTGGWTLPGPWEPRRLLLYNPQAIPLPEKGMLGPRL
ncbi:MAG: N-acetyltransferase [Sphingomonadaceae bacterium]|nr:N-acetyltransferase [Sphingomonadaceae bacterium]